MTDNRIVMPLSRRRFLQLSTAAAAASTAPLIGVSGQAFANEPDTPVKVGYMPITDATPLLVAHHNKLWEKQGLKVETPRMFRGWEQIVEAFLSGQVNVVHMLSPMTVYARYGSKSPSKVVAWNHTDGSSLAVTVAHPINSLKDLAGTTVAIPFWYSIHNIVLQLLLRKEGVEPISDGTPSKSQVKLVVMAPSDMLPALATGRVSGYIVAEPFVALAEVKKVGKVLRFTGDVWKNHACCVVQMHEYDLDKRPEWSQKVLNGLVEAQVWTRDNRDQAAHVLSQQSGNRYTPHRYEPLAKVLAPAASDTQFYQDSGAVLHDEWHSHRIDFQPYPYPSYTEKLVELMKQTVVKGNSDFLQKLDPAFVAKDLVDDRFVKHAIERVGGMSVFDQPEGYQREEVISA